MPLVQADACHIRTAQCAPPLIVTHPFNVHTEPGGSATFTVAATSELPLAIQWQSSLDGGVTFVDVPGATGPTWTIRTEFVNDSRQVRARVSTRDGVVSSDSASLMVQQATAASYFPTQIGTRWVYRRSDGADPDVVRVIGTSPVDGGQSGVVFETTDGKDRSVSRDIYSVSTDAVRQYSPDAEDAFLRALDGMQVLRFPVKIGDSARLLDKTVDSEVDVDDDGQTDLMQVVASLTVVGIEPISTPASRFERALHQRLDVVTTFFSSRGLGSVEVRSVVDVWFAAGVGQVKWIARQTAPGVNQTATYELQAFEVGSLQSDVIPPRVQQRSPEGASIRPTRTVTVVFDESIDPTSVGPDSLVVVDGQGRHVSGVVQVSGSSVTFAPAADWSDGTYSVSLAAGLRDFAGNVQPMGALWSFTADSVRPQVASTHPFANAKDVPLDSTVEITFTELPALSTINDFNLSIYRKSPGSAYSLKTTKTIRGNTVIITPEVQLQQGSEYEVRLARLADAAGNSVPDMSWRFRTVEGRFTPQAPIALPLYGIGKVVVADINGDGLQDVVLTASSGPQTPGTFVRYGQADGTLAEPVRLPGTTDCANYLSVADVNGDGRLDLLSSDDSCRPTVFEQAANGVFIAGQTLVGSRATAARFVNFGEQGKPAILLGMPPSVDIWQRSDAGVWRPTATVPTGSSNVVAADIDRNGSFEWVSTTTNGPATIDIRWRGAAGDYSKSTYLPIDWGDNGASGGVAVGDLNGDGRPDIVATVAGDPKTSVIALLYQDSAGTFKAPVFIKTGGWAQSIAIADIDGDGRADLVVSHNLYPEQMGFYLQRPDGTFAPEDLYDAEMLRGGPIVVADVNRDGRPDVLVGAAVFLQKPEVKKSVTTAIDIRPPARHSALPAMRGVRGIGGVNSRRMLSPISAWTKAQGNRIFPPFAQHEPARSK